MTNEINVKFKKLDERAVIPSYAHNGDVGMDLTAIGVEYDVEKDMYIYHTGLSFESDFNYGQLLFPRSSNRKTEAYLCNHVGIADSAIYRGEILFCFKNRTSIDDVIARRAVEVYDDKLEQCIANGMELNNAILNAILDKRLFIQKSLENKQELGLSLAPYQVGDRIGQMVFVHYPTVNLVESENLSETDRGANGFGSSGN